MTNLSELSKPVAYTDVDELRFHHATSDMWPITLGFGKDVPLYSQEYVSALLAELEASKQYAKERDLENEGLALTVGRLRVEMEEMDKRIAELDRSETQLIEQRDIAHDAIDAMYEAATGERPEWSNWFVFSDAIEEVAQVRAKLATPVQLPTQEIYDDPLSAHLAINDSADAIRAAGFTVEGDE